MSHVRFGKDLIRKPYLINQAQFVACHNFSFLEKYEMVEKLMDGGTFLLTCPYLGRRSLGQAADGSPAAIIDKKAKFYVIDAIKLGKKLGLGARINMIMQTAFFVISGILPKDKAIEAIKEAIVKTYGTKGEKVVNMNFAAVDAGIRRMEEVKYPTSVTSKTNRPPVVPALCAGIRQERHGARSSPAAATTCRCRPSRMTART